MTNTSVQATADATQMLFNLRLKFSSEIPITVWKMMAHAEQHLNRELESYFRPEGNSSAEPAEAKSA